MRGIAKNEEGARSGSGVQARPLVLARTLYAYRQAAKERWGNEGLAAIASKMPDDARASVATGALESGDDAWLPESWVEHFCEAMWDGPAARDERVFREVCDRMLDLGFGRVRKLLLSVATPHGLLRRAGDLWREEMTHGRLVTYGAGDTQGVATLHDHRWNDSVLMRLAVAEIFRYSLSLTGAKDVGERHERVESGALIVHLDWR